MLPHFLLLPQHLNCFGSLLSLGARTPTYAIHTVPDRWMQISDGMSGRIRIL
jgi:hypothetical protein